MIVEGVISIKEGENPKYIQEKLLNFLEEKDLRKKEGEEKKAKPEKKDKKKFPKFPK